MQSARSTNRIFPQNRAIASPKTPVSGGWLPPRVRCFTVRRLTRDQDLPKNVKIASQDPQPHISDEPALRPIAATRQTVARLQRADGGLDSRMPLPRLVERHARLCILLRCLPGTRLGQARSVDNAGQFFLVLWGVKASIKDLL